MIWHWPKYAGRGEQGTTSTERIITTRMMRLIVSVSRVFRADSNSAH